MTDVFCIAAGQLNPKKADTRINRKNRYLNFGLLSVATQLKLAGLNPIQLQGDFIEPEIFLKQCLNRGIEHTNRPILLSVPTFYALEWASIFLVALKSTLPNCVVFVGGRWTIDGSPDQLKRHLPQADRIVDGMGEQKILQLFNLRRNAQIEPIPKLDFSILSNRFDYQPSIEVSRGCGMGCSFCQESDIRLSKMKPVPEVVTELNQTLLQNDSLRPMTPYFQASMFRPPQKWLEELITHKSQLPTELQWRTQSRVDMLSATNMNLLAESGLKVLDLGLESASPKQLKAMGKTTKPDAYLRKASKLIEAAASHDIFVKLNLLLFAGETEETTEETRSWLNDHKSLFKGISIGPVLAFGWPRNSAGFISLLESLGAKANHEASFTGVTKFDLSPSISHETALDISNRLSAEFMDTESYFALKAFSYFPRSYRYENFLTDLNEHSKEVELLSL